MKARLLIPISVGLLAGCGTPETHEQMSRPLSQASTVHPNPAPTITETYVGGTIFKVDRTKPLPNVFGKPDMFGRKVYAGYTELRYQGMTDDGRILLRVTEVETHSTETTMSR